MNLNQKAALMIRTLMRDHHVSDHIVFPEGESPVSSGTILAALDEDPMKTLLRQMFQGWINHEKASTQGDVMVPGIPAEPSMVEACDGDERKGLLLVLFGHWSNDILSIAAHYGLALARRQPDGTLLHADGTVDTLLKGGTLEIVDIPPAPSEDHYWYAGEWKAPEPDMSGEELG